jgi:transcriptional regulator with XRE-family HTH domain
MFFPQESPRVEQRCRRPASAVVKVGRGVKIEGTWVMIFGTAVVTFGISVAMAGAGVVMVTGVVPPRQDAVMIFNTRVVGMGTAEEAMITGVPNRHHGVPSTATVVVDLATAVRIPGTDAASRRAAVMAVGVGVPKRRTWVWTVKTGASDWIHARWKTMSALVVIFCFFDLTAFKRCCNFVRMIANITAPAFGGMGGIFTELEVFKPWLSTHCVRIFANTFPTSMRWTDLAEPRNLKTAKDIMSQHTLGEFIKERRQFLELSQRKLAQMIGIKAASHLCDVENGYRQLGEEHLDALAKALQVTREELKDKDPRAPLAEAHKLMERDPAFIPALNRMVRMIGELPPREVERRLRQTNPAAPEPAPEMKPPPSGES